MVQLPASFLFIFVFSNTNFTEKNVSVSGIRTRIIGAEGEHADHLTATTAPSSSLSFGRT